jgi:hypothetical protein
MVVTALDHPRRGPQPVMVYSSHPGIFESKSWRFPGLTLVVDGALEGPGPSFSVPDAVPFTLRPA